jgi:hypothetical protein
MKYVHECFDIGSIFTAVKKQTLIIVETVEQLTQNSVTRLQTEYRSETIIDGKVETKFTANIGDWLVMGVEGELYSIKGENFNSLYQVENGIAYPIQKKYLIHLDETFWGKYGKDLEWSSEYGDSFFVPRGSDYYLFSNAEEHLVTGNMSKIFPLALEAYQETY